jgi:Uma2 family endonuclease
METDEIVLPETKPETEWVRGRALRKVSPRRDHGRMQAALAVVLGEWASGRGEVATEWRFRVAPPGEVRRPLVPDVSYVSAERLRGLDDEAYQVPPFAPDVAVEILSPGDLRADVAEKIDVYLRGGSLLVLVIDTTSRTFAAHDASGVRTFTVGETFSHTALPGLSLSLGPLFAKALDRIG